MNYILIILSSVLLTFLAGNFTLDRLGFESNFQVSWVFTLLTFILMMLKPIKLYKAKILNKSFLMFISLTFIMLIYNLTSFGFSDNYSISFLKVLDNFALLIIIILVIYISQLGNIRYIFDVMSIFFILVSILYSIPIILQVVNGASRGGVSIGGYNVITRILFMGLISSIYRYQNKNKIIYVLLIVIFTASIFLTGSRGGMIGFTFIIFMYLLLNIKKVSKLKISYNSLFYVVPIIITSYLLIPYVIGIIKDRIFKVTFDSGNGIYTAGRDQFYEQAISMIKNHPIIGNGIDSFEVKTGNMYPHNMFLELFLENGIIGLIYFVFLVIISVNVIKKNFNTEFSILSFLPLYMITVQMFSGEFYDFRYFYLWIIPFLTMEKLNNKECV